MASGGADVLVGTLRGSAAVVAGGLLCWWRMVASLVIAMDLLLVRDAKSNCAAGCFRARMMSLAAALMTLAEEGLAW